VSVTRRVVRTNSGVWSSRSSALIEAARLGHQEPFRRPGEVLVLGDGDEVLQVAQFHD
jgi:hypothetical protein